MKAYYCLLPLAVALGVMSAAPPPKPVAKAPAKAAPKTASKAAPRAVAKQTPQRAAPKTQATYRRAAPTKAAPVKGNYNSRRPVVRTANGRRVQAPVRSWRATQQIPSNDRYKEVQEALSAKGYTVNADGAWSADSVEALKRFQKDQNLDPSGKLNSLSLIALGLGPKRASATISSLNPAPSGTGAGSGVSAGAGSTQE